MPSDDWKSCSSQPTLSRSEWQGIADSPGAANAMVILGEAEGADARLVAFMQYSRVLLVALAAALVAHSWAHVGNAHAPGAP